MATTQDDTIAELQRTVAELRRERDAALAREAALAEVLDVINRSPDDPGPVFDTVLEKAHSLCGAAIGALSTFDGTLMHTLAMRGFPDDYSARMREPWPPPAATAQRLIDSADVVHIPDATEVGHGLGFLTGRTDMRTALVVPLRKDGVFLGQITAFRDEVRPFAETEIALLESFAAQAVIAMENARLLGELHERTAELAERNSAFGERIEHQSATIDVLKAMSASPGDAQPVFDLIAKRARDICGGYGVTVCEFDGSLLQWRAATGVSEDPAIREAAKAAFPMPPTRDRPLGRAILDREIFHSRDHNTEPGLLRLPHYDTVKSSVTVPMMSGGVAIGALALGSREKGGFSDAQVDLLKTFAEQAVIAISSAETYRALQARTAELTARDAANRALIARQSASVEVLKAISASPDDPQPVFELIARLTRELCVASRASVTEYDGALLHMRARDGYDPTTALLGDRDWPRPPGPDTIHGRVIQNGGVIQVHDVNADDAYAQVAREIMRRLGSRSLLGVPLLREGRVIGAITLGRDQTGGFGDDQVELVRSFAEQAVIAISSATALRALHQRTSDLQESLEYQTATSDVLKVIGRSTFDLQPVLDAVVETAARLCDAEMAVLTRSEGDRLRMVANYGFPPAYEAHQRSRGLIPRVPDSPSAGQRAWHERRAVHIRDAATVPGYPQASLRLANQRTTLAVPLMRNGEPIGTLSLARQHVEPFTDRQIELVSTFADQAVIAIENTRLITEQREALEQQIAAAEVLQVINANPGNVVPVFDSILENAHRVCGASIGSLWLYDGEMIHAAATRGVPEELGAQLRRPRRPSIAQEALIREKGRFFHSVDRQTDGAELNQEVEATGVRTILGVPLVKDDRVIGIISAHRPETRPFSDKEIVLLENFAAQAVIAIENTRLINEQREALEQQTATAEVLRVINGSPGDLAPVFEAILEKAHTLCGATIGALATYDGEFMHPVAIHGYPDDYVEQARQRYRPSPVGGQALIGGARFNHLPDMQAIQPTPLGHAGVVIERTGLRTFLAVPLRKDGVFLGQISAFRTEVRPFSDKEIALLENFAAQAVIAMDNARLLGELRDRTADLAERNTAFAERIEHQAATIDVLKAMSASPGDPQPVFDLICQQANTLVGTSTVGLFEYDGELVHYRSTSSLADMAGAASSAAFASAWPRIPDRGSLTCRAILDGRIVHVRDLAADPSISEMVRDLGHRSQISVPLMRNGSTIGAISMASLRVDGFSDTQIELLKTFADQAVIAITSAQTYRALQTRTADLQESLDYQTATSDVLKVISRSTFDLQPVLDAVVETAARLCDADMAFIFRRYGEVYRLVSNWGFPPEFEAFLKTQALAPGRASVTQRTALEGRIIHVHDMAADPEYALPKWEMAHVRTGLGVPLLRDGVMAGVIALARREVQPFTERQIEVVGTFADQAVIAIENTRLLTEQQEALEQQTATAEVLQVINASPGNLAPVFDAMLDKAMRLMQASYGILNIFDGTIFRRAAARGVPAAYEAFSAQNTAMRSSEEFARPVKEFLQTKRPVHILDLREDESYRSGHSLMRALADIGNARTNLWVPLVKDDVVLGVIGIYRTEVRAFSAKEIALLENFAAQAVVAMENARLLGELQDRTAALAQRNSEFGERIEQQAATIDVLKVMSSKPDDTQPVFDQIVRRAKELCNGDSAVLFQLRDRLVHFGAMCSDRDLNTPAMASYLAEFPMAPTRGSIICRTILDSQIIHIEDIQAEPELSQAVRALIKDGNYRSQVAIPLMRDGQAVGCISLTAARSGGFTDSQISLLQTFAEQAVIAIGSVATFRALRERTAELAQRQEELRVTFENMGDGVAMFDDTQNLVAWNRKFQDLLEVPDEIIAQRRSLPDYVRYLAERGEFGTDADVDEQVRRVLHTTGQMRVFERVRPNGNVIEVHSNPIAGGGFVLIYSDITERRRNEEVIRAARDAAEQASRAIEAAFLELKTAQANLIQAEKMASLGQLTAGIAHEIKNPLNFVNNFAALSVDLLSELKETAAPGFAALTDAQRAEINDVSAMLTSNLEKITEHGKRADGIVKAMLEHSRGASGERRTVDINALADEALNLAYHGARAQDQSFNITLERDFEDGIAPIEVNPQDMTRVFLNLFSNGFYAANKRERNGAHDFGPVLKVTTRAVGDDVEIRVRDNGAGIPDEIRDKLFQPFFTTKPTGVGTGLGLSITYDIVTKAHGGTIVVASEVGDHSEFVVTLPRQMFAVDGAAA